MYNTILVPLDGSKRAEVILPHVEELAQRNNAKVVFIRVVEPYRIPAELEITSFEQTQEAFNKLQAKQAESYLAGLKEKFREQGINAYTLVINGSVVEAIINAAESEGADLIAIASHGRSGLPRVFYGSVAAGVLHRVDRPLLVIRSRRNK